VLAPPAARPGRSAGPRAPKQRDPHEGCRRARPSRGQLASPQTRPPSSTGLDRVPLVCRRDVFRTEARRRSPTRWWGFRHSSPRRSSPLAHAQMCSGRRARNHPALRICRQPAVTPVGSTPRRRARRRRAARWASRQDRWCCSDRQPGLQDERIIPVPVAAPHADVPVLNYSDVTKECRSSRRSVRIGVEQNADYEVAVTALVIVRSRALPRPGFSTEAVQTPARVNVTCVTPLGEEVASTS
jgi:hypothetical protein